MTSARLIPLLTPTILVIFIIFIFASEPTSADRRETSDARKYPSVEYDKDMLETVLKEVINDEITKLSKPSARGSQGEDRSDRLESSRKASSSSVGMDEYLDRMSLSSDRQQQFSDHHQRSPAMHRPSQEDDEDEIAYQPKPRGREKGEGVSDGSSTPNGHHSNNHYRDLQQEVLLLEERLRMEKIMRQKLEQQEARLREEKMLQDKLREERKKLEQLFVEEKVKHEVRRQKHKQDQDDLSVAALNDGISDSSDLDRINLKSYSSAMAAAQESDSLKALSVHDPEEISLKSLQSSLSQSDTGSKFFNHVDLMDDSLPTLTLRPSDRHSSLESSMRPSFGPMSSSLMPTKSMRSRPHISFGHGMHPQFPPSFGSSHAASNYAPSYGPKFGSPFMPPLMPGSPMRPRPMPPFGNRPYTPNLSPFPGSMGSFGSASSLSPLRFPPPMGQSSLHTIAASMYPSLYPMNPTQRSSSLAAANSPYTIAAPGSQMSSSSASESGDKRDPKTGKKLKSMLMDFAVSSILDVGMMGLIGNVLGKMNADPGSSS